MRFPYRVTDGETVETVWAHDAQDAIYMKRGIQAGKKGERQAEAVDISGKQIKTWMAGNEPTREAP